MFKFTVVMFSIILSVSLYFALNYASQVNRDIITVQDGYISYDKDNKAQKRIITTSGETFTVEDQMLGQFVFNSADVYSQLLLNKGKEICVKSFGYRNTFMSVFPNIVEIKPMDFCNG